MTFGIVSIVAGLLTFLVSDVADISLPDTVKEAEAIGVKEVTETKYRIPSNVVLNSNNDMSKDYGLQNFGFESRELKENE